MIVKEAEEQVKRDCAERTLRLEFWVHRGDSILLGRQQQLALPIFGAVEVAHLVPSNVLVVRYKTLEMRAPAGSQKLIAVMSALRTVLDDALCMYRTFDLALRVVHKGQELACVDHRNLSELLDKVMAYMRHAEVLLP